MRRTAWIWSVAVLLALALPRQSRGDLLLWQRETGPSPDGSGQRTSEKQIAVAREMMRIRDLDTAHVVIVRLDKKVVWDLSPDGMEYVEIPFDYLQTMGNFESLSEEEILTAQLKLAGPDEREELEAALADARRREQQESAEERRQRQELQAERRRLAERPPDIAWSGRTARIAGFQAREATLSVDSQTVAEVWVTNDAFFRDELDAYLEAMGSLGQGGGGAAELKSLEGFPVRTILYPIGDAEAQPLTIEITKAERDHFAPWEFDLPPGIERADFLPLREPR